MLHRLGRIPVVGDAADVDLDGGERRVRLTVTRMRKRRVEGLRVEEVQIEVPAELPTEAEVEPAPQPAPEAVSAAQSG
jgi:hypothetical protein